MTAMNIDQVLDQALQLHQSGRFVEAEAMYRQILAQQPNDADVLFLLGSLAHQTRRMDLAEELIRKAIAVNPSASEYHLNLGVVLMASGRLEQAVGVYRRAIALMPDFADGYYNLALALFQLKHLDEAVSAFRQALAINPNHIPAHQVLGNALIAQNRLEEAVESYRRVVALMPDDPVGFQSLATALVQLGRLEEAVAAYERVVALRPDDANDLNALGVVLARLGRAEEALVIFRKALPLNPDYAAVYNNAGLALKNLGRPEEALDFFRRAVALRPDFAEYFSNLGTGLFTLARLDDALEALRQARELKPDEPNIHSNAIFTMCFHPDFDAMAILRECLKWDERHGKPARPFMRPHPNSPDPDRRLRIGYVSSDFRGHVVGRNLLPHMREHDHERFEVFCYSSGASDEVTDKLRAECDHWRDVARFEDEKLAEQIRADGIDVLIDLALHTANNRLPIFARVPAPVQISYLGYCSTTGIEGIHYRFSDPHLDPPETDLNCYSEKTIHLPETYWCYEPGGATPEVSPLPAEKAGHITFGCLNKFAKVSAPALELWCEILKRAPASRLLIHAPPGEHLRRVRERLDRHGIVSDRVEFVGQQDWAQYVLTFGRIDIGLDPMPFGGGITTCDTLWMGVPLVSLSGQTAVGRGGRSILCNLGLSELVAYSPEQYVNIAVGLAGDVPRLAELRRTLRDRMKVSPLMDAGRFAANVEAAYRQVWKRWCAEQRK